MRILVILCFFTASQNAPAYSVLTHEQIVDLLWKSQIRPILLARYPGTTDDQMRQAHAYAYGGCLIQDIGYYPFGNHFFSDLTHYVRSGDFVSNMLSEAEKSGDINQYAFALGSLAHYASDIAGHPAVNKAVADYFPKLRAKYGDIVTYEDNHSAHIRTEFGFDVVQVAKDRFTSQAFHDFIGFEVSKPLLEKTVLATYGLPLETIFPNFDMAVGSFRYSVSRLIPQMTRVALAMKKDEIVKEDPTMTRKRFLYHLKVSQYRREWGRTYQRPNFGDRLLAFIISILPKIGPLKTLDFKMPTPSTENLYMQSVNNSATQYGDDLTAIQTNALNLENKDFDTGKETKAGEYALTDATYADLLNKLAGNHFANLTPDLQTNILAFYKDPQPPAFAAKNPAKWSKTRSNLAQLQAFQTSSVTSH
ncbi:zinc dependent phospholipase C family protein [Acidicapsa acidisoli]|uniref:zinc dependent phospholipase C family protein n=1 Tax=Acidicapsa acidisoli TaxID=1615681 RepID=UPI0021DFE4ED|nr:zinc dependent phospholipase C family protein [Acidicapsa acidisoli]